MKVIKTPEERFRDMADFPYPPKFAEVSGVRMHYVEAGSGNEAVLCLHGEPTWSYLYRKMIPVLSKKYRVVAPDFIGFGRSEKFTSREDYTYAMHRDSLVGFIEALDLKNIIMVVQDWGGLVGLRVAGMVAERMSRLVIMNTGLPSGEGEMPEAFMKWRQFVASSDDLPIGMIMQGGTVSELPPEVLAAYEAPFPGPEHKAGAKMWPLLVPVSPEDEAAPEMKAARDDLAGWDKPALVMFSDGDPITKGGDGFFRELIPTAKQQPEIIIQGGGHFLQEDKGEEIAENIVEFMQRTSG